MVQQNLASDKNWANAHATSINDGDFVILFINGDMFFVFV